MYIHLCLLYFVCAVNCLIFESFNTSEPVWKQLEALEHVHTFLLSVQKEIKESRDLLNHLNSNNVLFSADEYPRKGQLRTPDNTATGVLTTAPAAVTPEVHKPTGTIPGQAREAVIPDFSPLYKDVFDNDDNTTIPIPIPVTSSKGTDVLSQVDKFVGEKRPVSNVSDVGNILMGHDLDDAEPEDTHPILHEQLVRDESGYFSVGFENLFMLVAKKKPAHVKDVLEHAFYTAQELDIQGGATHLRWLGQPMTEILTSVFSNLVPEVIDIQEVQAQANVLWKLLKERRRLLSENANHIIDFADGMIKKKDGDEMFDRLDDFKAFPALPDLSHAEFMRPVYKTGPALCYGIITSFARPFVTTTVDRERLVSAANAAFKEHFGDVYVRSSAQLWPKLNSWLKNPVESQTKQTNKLGNLSRKSNHLNLMSNRRTMKRSNTWKRSESPKSYYLRTMAFKNSNINNNKYNDIYNAYRKYYNEANNLIKSRYVFPKAPNFYTRPNEGTQNRNKMTISYTVINKAVTPPYRNIDFRNNIKSNSKIYKSLNGPRDTIHRRVNIATTRNLENVVTNLSPSVNLTLNISNTEPKYVAKATNDSIESYYEDISKSMNVSDETAVLDFAELNNLLNVTGKEILEDENSVMSSIETDEN